MKKITNVGLALLTAFLITGIYFSSITTVQNATGAEQSDLCRAVLPVDALPNEFQQEEASLSDINHSDIFTESLPSEYQDYLYMCDVYTYSRSDFPYIEIIGFMIFGFSEQIPIEYIEKFGITSHLVEEFKSTALDSLIDNSTGVSLVLEENRVLSNITPVGNEFSGRTIKINTSLMPLRVDLAAFRRNRTIAVILMAYIDGSEPSVSISEITPIMDARILEFNE